MIFSQKIFLASLCFTAAFASLSKIKNLHIGERGSGLAYRNFPLCFEDEIQRTVARNWFQDGFHEQSSKDDVDSDQIKNLCKQTEQEYQYLVAENPKFKLCDAASYAGLLDELGFPLEIKAHNGCSVAFDSFGPPLSLDRLRRLFQIKNISEAHGFDYPAVYFDNNNQLKFRDQDRPVLAAQGTPIYMKKIVLGGFFFVTNGQLISARRILTIVEPELLRRMIRAKCGELQIGRDGAEADPKASVNDLRKRLLQLTSDYLSFKSCNPAFNYCDHVNYNGLYDEYGRPLTTPNKFAVGDCRVMDSFGELVDFKRLNDILWIKKQAEEFKLPYPCVSYDEDGGVSFIDIKGNKCRPFGSRKQPIKLEGNKFYFRVSGKQAKKDALRSALREHVLLYGDLLPIAVELNRHCASSALLKIVENPGLLLDISVLDDEEKEDLMLIAIAKNKVTLAIKLLDEVLKYSKRLEYLLYSCFIKTAYKYRHMELVNHFMNHEKFFEREALEMAIRDEDYELVKYLIDFIWQKDPSLFTRSAFTHPGPVMFLVLAANSRNYGILRLLLSEGDKLMFNEGQINQAMKTILNLLKFEHSIPNLVKMLALLISHPQSNPNEVLELLENFDTVEVNTAAIPAFKALIASPKVDLAALCKSVLENGFKIVPADDQLFLDILDRIDGQEIIHLGYRLVIEVSQWRFLKHSHVDLFSMLPQSLEIIYTELPADQKPIIKQILATAVFEKLQPAYENKNWLRKVISVMMESGVPIEDAAECAHALKNNQLSTKGFAPESPYIPEELRIKIAIEEFLARNRS